ncbi:MAG: hypothetical protein HQL32_01465 [Planctomycetes bacterium]|nr:hypothetical protein [Planctomycetota bacterium]
MKTTKISFFSLLGMSIVAPMSAEETFDLQVQFQGEEESLVSPYDEYTDALSRRGKGHTGPIKSLSLDESRLQETPNYAGRPDMLGPSTARMKYETRYPDHEYHIRNVMNPIPVPNNAQVYPFVLTVPMEGGELLKFKEMELAFTQTFVDGSMEGESARYSIDMNQWHFEQSLSYSIGLPNDLQFTTSIPLYHFSGENSMTQDGVELMGLSSKTRNFWGAPTISLKKQIFDNKSTDVRGQTSIWMQFPEGNQRGRGGTSSSHWAINQIFEKYDDNYRFTLNLGVIKGGELQLLNDGKLKQKLGYFMAFSASKKLSPTLALEAQLHGYRSALSQTKLDDLDELTGNGVVGVRKHFKGFDLSLSGIMGFSEQPEFGSSLDIRYHW